MLEKSINTSVDLIGDSIIHHTIDAWGDIFVLDHRHYRSLMFDSYFEQSSMDVNKPHILVHNYTRTMMLVLAFIKPRHVTLLGLGGGCLLRSLYHLLPECKLHAIELRQHVYETATDFFGIPTSKQITITIADAQQQLKNIDNNSTNIIFADLYNAYSMSPLQIQKDFISECYRVLSYKGWLVVNYHGISDLDTGFLQYLYSIFSDIFVCCIPNGNSILFASKHSTDTLDRFEGVVAILEKKLEIKLKHLFQRLTRLCPTYANSSR